MSFLEIGDAEILAARPDRNYLRVDRPYASLVEPERSESGTVVEVATVFLTNRECPFRCLMCDLWKNTTSFTVPVGAIPKQIEWAIKQLPAAQQIKLYNSGNFFDPLAIPVADYEPIAKLVGGYETVIVENHPKLCSSRVFEFQDMLEPQLEVAMGLETIDPQVLPRLNKQMTTVDFSRAAERLLSRSIRLRTFILLRTPFQSEEEGVEWAIKSLEFAFANGVSCCCLVPTRATNGIMEQLETAGQFHSPRLRSLEIALESGLAMKRGRVFADLWDLEKFFDCDHCGPARKERINQMNLSQELLPRVECNVCGSSKSP